MHPVFGEQLPGPSTPGLLVRCAPAAPEPPSGAAASPRCRRCRCWCPNQGSGSVTLEEQTQGARGEHLRALPHRTRGESVGFVTFSLRSSGFKGHPCALRALGIAPPLVHAPLDAGLPWMHLHTPWERVRQPI